MALWEIFSNEKLEVGVSAKESRACQVGAILLCQLFQFLGIFVYYILSNIVTDKDGIIIKITLYKIHIYIYLYFICISESGFC